MEITEAVQILVGLGIVGGMWRLNSSVAALTARLEALLPRVDDHERRLRRIERPNNA
jgi:hypothetical protein